MGLKNEVQGGMGAAPDGGQQPFGQGLPGMRREAREDAGPLVEEVPGSGPTSMLLL